MFFRFSENHYWVSLNLSLNLFICKISNRNIKNALQRSWHKLSADAAAERGLKHSTLKSATHQKTPKHTTWRDEGKKQTSPKHKNKGDCKQPQTRRKKLHKGMGRTTTKQRKGREGKKHRQRQTKQRSNGQGTSTTATIKKEHKNSTYKHRATHTDQPQRQIHKQDWTRQRHEQQRL